MDQSRKDSMLEATANIALGMVVAWSITFTANTYITTPAPAAPAARSTAVKTWQSLPGKGPG